jgi:hypothetical protein
VTGQSSHTAGGITFTAGGATDVTANGGGITIKGTTDKTFTWVTSASAFTSSEDINIVTGKQYEINGTSVLNATTLGSSVTASSLTSFGNIPAMTSPVITTSLTTPSTSFDLLNTTATTVNFAGAATTFAIGASSGTLTIGNATITGTNATALNLNGASPGIVTTSTGTAAVFNTNALTGNLFGAATSISVGATTGTTTVRNPNVSIGSAAASTNVALLLNGVANKAQRIVFQESGVEKWLIGQGAASETSAFEIYNSTGTTVLSINKSTSVSTFGASISAPNGNISASGSVTANGSGVSGGFRLFTNSGLTASNNYFNIFTSQTSGWSFNANGTGADTDAKCTISLTGVVTSTNGFVESSSIALKENINPITGALDAIMNLVGVTYDRKNGSSKNEAGLIAEEVDRVIPNLVSHKEDGTADGIYYSKLTAYLVEAIKDLKSQIDPLKEEIRKLKGE